MKEIYKTKIFTIFEEEKNGHDVVRIDSPDWVNIIAFNENDDILFIKQYRHGTQEETLEIPGGLIDKTDETPLDAAKRELLEETGYSASKWEENGEVLANPAYQNNTCFFFIAKDVKKTHEQNFDTDENITETFFIPKKKVFKMLKNGEISHSIIYANLAKYFLNNHKVTL
jgi:8-oxo-dGTP pyrophosphatase MutT (NUDIX family)